MNFYFWFFLFLSVNSWAAKQSASVQGIQLQAENMLRDTENEIIDLDGSVQVIFKDQHIKCDRARINLRAKTVDATGDVLVTSPQANIGGDRIIIDYENGTGLIYFGYVQSGTVIFEGSLITKTSDIDYIADDAKYTACTTCPETWSFTGKKIRAELGGYAYIKSSWLRFANMPTIWLPYLIVPLKSDRQSGLLTPNFEQSGGGLAIAQSYFWAISRSQDATITAKNYELRGLKPIFEYNYVLGENSYGSFRTAFLRDRVFASESRLNDHRNINQKNEVLNRWFINYNHYYELPDGYVQRAMLANSSDLQYPEDFDSEMPGKLDSSLENRISITKNTAKHHFSVDSSYYINLLNSNPLANNDDSVHRLPELTYSKAVSKIPGTDFLYTFRVNYVNFVRSGFGFDNLNSAYSSSTSRHVTSTDPNDPNNSRCSSSEWYKSPECIAVSDGKYDENTDLIRTGQRLDINPTIYHPIKIGPFLDITPKLSFRDTYYSFGVGEHATISRKYLRAELSAKTIASHIYGDRQIKESNLIKHEIQPEVTATTIPWINQPSHPFFGSSQLGDVAFSGQQFVSDSDLNSPFGLQFDYNDRLYDRKLVTFGVTNKLTSKTWKNGKPEYFQFFSWKLAQSFDAFQSERGDPFKQSLSDLSSDIRITLKYFDLTQQANYFPYQQVVNTNTVIKLLNEYQDTLLLRYSNQYAITAGKEADYSSRTENYAATIRKYTKSIDLLATAVYNPNTQNKFILWAYGIEFKIPGDCSSIKFYEKREGDKKPERKLFFDFVWDGQAKSNFINQLSSSSPFSL